MDKSIKNMVLVLIAPVLMASFLANGMEVVPSKKLAKTSNLIRNYNKTEKNIELPVLSEQEFIKAKAYINKDNKACYSSEKRHELLKRMGITSYLNDPLIVLGMTHVNDIKPIKIECTDNNPASILFNEKYSIEIEPLLLPAGYLYGKKTNDIIELILYNHPIQIACINNPISQLSFEEEFNKKIQTFQNKCIALMTFKVGLGYSFCFGDVNWRNADNPLIEKQIIIATNIKHHHNPSLDMFANNVVYGKIKTCQHGKNGYKFDQIATDIINHQQTGTPYRLNDKQNIFNLLNHRQTTGSLVNKHTIRQIDDTIKQTLH